MTQTKMATAIHQYEDKLLDFAYGELPAPEASAVESHVKSCTRCTQALDQIRGVRTTMSALPQEPAPTAGLESLLAYAEQSARRSAAGTAAAAPWWRRLVAPLAGAMALVLVGVVAWRTQEEGMDFSKEKAAIEASHARAPQVAQASPPSEVAAPEQPEQLAKKLQMGKMSGAAEARADGERREGKADRAWDTQNENDALARNAPSQQLGQTAAPAMQRQGQLNEELRAGLSTAAKESKTRRASAKEQPADKLDQAGADDFDSAFGSGAGAATKDAAPGPTAKKSAPPPPARDGTYDDYSNSAQRGAVYGDARKSDNAGKNENKNEKAPIADTKEKAKGEAPSKVTSAAPATQAPMGLSTAPAEKPKPAPPPAPVVAANSAPAAQPESEKKKSSLQLGLGSSSYGGSSSGSSAVRGSGSGSGYRTNSDDETAAHGANEIADRKRMESDVGAQQLGQEKQARVYLDAARSAGNNGNRQEEVKQALAALATNVRGAPRAEALERACTGFEAMGEEAQADRFCDALLREFPNLTASRTIAQRRNQVQRAPAPKAAKSPAAAANAPSKIEPAGESPAKAKKAAEDRAVDSY